jgi:hypothetical protein
MVKVPGREASFTAGMPFAKAAKLALTWVALIGVPPVKVGLGSVTAATAKPRDDARTATLIHWLRDSLKMFFPDFMFPSE